MNRRLLAELPLLIHPQLNLQHRSPTRNCDFWQKYFSNLNLNHLLPVDAKERPENVDGGASTIPTNRRHVLDPLRHVHELEVVLPVDLRHHLNQLLALLFCHLYLVAYHARDTNVHVQREYLTLMVFNLSYFSIMESHQ